MPDFLNNNNNNNKNYGKGMFFFAWIIIFSFFYYFFHNWYNDKINPNKKVLFSIDSKGNREVVLKRNQYNSYLASGTINSHPVVFIVDTGATQVAVPLALSQALQLKKGPQIMLETAGGTVMGYQTRIKQLTVGPIELTDIAATVTPTMSEGEVLLGMSALKKINFRQEQDNLILQQNR